jgi:hypothetical protein
MTTQYAQTLVRAGINGAQYLSASGGNCATPFMFYMVNLREHEKHERHEK